MTVVSVENSSLQYRQTHSPWQLVWSEGWHSHPVLFYIHQMNQICCDDSNVNVVVVVVVVIIVSWNCASGCWPEPQLYCFSEFCVTYTHTHYRYVVCEMRAYILNVCIYFRHGWNCLRPDVVPTFRRCVCVQINIRKATYSRCSYTVRWWRSATSSTSSTSQSHYGTSVCRSLTSLSLMPAVFSLGQGHLVGHSFMPWQLQYMHKPRVSSCIWN